MGQVRPALQAGVVEGLPHLSRELQQRVKALLEAPDWGGLELETQALGLAVGQPEETWAWLGSSFATHPAEAIELALTAGRWGLRFARAGGRFVRVPVHVGVPPVPVIPPPVFWRVVRAVVDQHPRLRRVFEEAVARHAVRDRRIRAGIAHVLWEDPTRWTSVDEQAVCSVLDADAGALLLLGLLRASGPAVASPEWPPPIACLNVLNDLSFFAACRWYPREVAGEAERARYACRASLGRPRAQRVSPNELLRRIAEPEGFLLLAGCVPHPDDLERARAVQPPAGSQVALLHDYLVTRWERVLEGDPARHLALEVAEGHRPFSSRELAALRRALTHGELHDPTALAPRVSPQALERFAAHRFLDSVVEDRGLRSRGAVASMRVVRSDAWTQVVRQLLGWAEHRRDTRLLRGCLGALRHQRTPNAFDGLAAFKERTRDGLLLAQVDALIRAVSEELGLGVEETRERLFPPVSPPPPGCRPVVAWGPAVVFETLDAQLPLVGDATIPVPARKPPPLPTDWARASVALRSLRPRLEQLMLDAPPMSAVHFTETWGMHPVLRLVAERLAWGAWDGERRVGLLIPGRLEAARLEEHHVVRPVHPAELTHEELAQLRVALPEAQPIEQLLRPRHLRVWRDGNSAELSVDERWDRHCLPPWRQVSEWSFAWSGRGWHAGLSFARREPGWRSARLFVNPSDGATSVPNRIKSEVARQAARWLTSPDLAPDAS